MFGFILTSGLRGHFRCQNMCEKLMPPTKWCANFPIVESTLLKNWVFQIASNHIIEWLNVGWRQTAQICIVNGKSKDTHRARGEIVKRVWGLNRVRQRAALLLLCHCGQWFLKICKQIITIITIIQSLLVPVLHLAFGWNEYRIY